VSALGLTFKEDISTRLYKLFSDDLTKWIVKVLLEKPEGVNIPWTVNTYFRNNIHLSNRKERQKLYQRVYRRIQTLAKHGIVIIDSHKNSRFNIIKLNVNRAMHVINLIARRITSPLRRGSCETSILG